MNIGIMQTNWFSGKLPEIMSIIYILEKFGIILDVRGIVIMAVLIFTSFIILGYLYVKLGFYKSERQVETNIDPIWLDVHNASKKINRSKKIW